jgi:dihydrofolate reductase
MIILHQLLWNKGDSHSPSWHNPYMQKPRISAIAIMSSKERALGRNNKLLWHIPEDLKHFKKLTVGHPIIMGRKTFESIAAYIGGPLPNRQTIVISKRADIVHPDVTMATSVEHALCLAEELDSEEIFLGGGATIYALALSYIDRLYLTLVENEPEADCYFPAYKEQFVEVENSKPQQTKDGLAFSFLTLDRKTGEHTNWPST